MFRKTDKVLRGNLCKVRASQGRAVLKADIQLTATVKCAVLTRGPCSCGIRSVALVLSILKLCNVHMQLRYMLEVTRMCLCILFSLCQIRKN